MGGSCFEMRCFAALLCGGEATHLRNVSRPSAVSE
jgi:hypothetical protein